MIPYQTQPDGSTLPVQLCQQNNGILSSCQNFATSRSFLYQGSIPNPISGNGAVISQTTVLQDPTIWRVFFTAPPTQVSHWLMLCSVTTGSDYSATASTSQSLPATMQLAVSRPCSLNNCVGCSQLSTQLLCYSAQQCQIANCIGSTVNINRPLCAIGMTFEANLNQYLSLLDGTWLIISESMVSILDVSGGVTPPTTILWPDQAFYGYICSTKDITATSISILMSSISGMLQASGQIPAPQAASHTQMIDNKANAIFTMNLASTTNFIFQLSLAPLYGLAAMQKTFICQANNLLSLVNTKAGSISVGDPSIQSASDIAAGQCMSQYSTENTQGQGNGLSNPTNSIANSAVSQMEAFTMNIALDSLIHPLDATFTWLSGAVSGLIDLVETADSIE